MKIIFALILVSISSLVMADKMPYPENDDALTQVQLLMAEDDARPILVTFGANWCSNCRKLAKVMKSPEMSQWLSSEYRVVKVNIGNWNKNQDLVAELGQPTKYGIPAMVVITPEESQYVAAFDLIKTLRKPKAEFQNLLSSL